MANQSNYFASHSNMPPSKVYVNPNYNRHIDNTPKQPTTMYVNPNFRQTTAHYYDNARTKIYLNPNFMGNSVSIPSQINQTVLNNYTRPTDTLFSDHSNFNTNYHQSTNLTKRQVANIADQTTTTQISKSRYCLVNKHESKTKPTQIMEVNTETISAPKVQSNTIRVNKYKLVPMSDIKSKFSLENKLENKIAIPSTITTKNLPQYKIKIKPVVQNICNRFKLVKQNTLLLNSSNKFKTNVSLNKSTRSLTSRKKFVKGVLKKNNIPCPLFKKYGKCLRNNRGHCEYLHDKKHVSICRKFLKGICHDTDCLLSHDLTDKKMPTCYFYLQGACTKENCPYLHVKLNDKANICQDFLKGYCEKGDKCLNRHVNLNLGKDLNQRKNVRTPSIMKIKVNVKSKSTTKEISSNKASSSDTKTVSEKRYFIDNIDMDVEKYDLIKPTRCKLGTLPSFIQL